MKTFEQFSAVPLSMAMALSLFSVSGHLRALGPGTPVAAVGANNGMAVGNANVGTRGASTGGAPVGSGGRSGSAPVSVGARSGVSFSNSPAQSFSGGLRQGVSGRTSAPTAAFRGSQSTSTAIPSSVAAQQFGRLPTAPRIGNAWSGPAYRPSNVGSRSTGPAMGYATRPSFYGGNGYTANRFAGQHLYRGSSASGLANVDANRFAHGPHNGTDADRNHSHKYHGYYPYYVNYGSSYPYLPGYLPYLGSYYGGYASPYYGVDSYYGLNTDSTATYADNNPAFDAPIPPAESDDSDSSRQQPRTDARQSAVPNNGPDSLVEAVQQELAKRGYFGGKIDAMYGTDTKEALRRFQTDRHLASTGLINEATLHALQLD